MESLVRGDCMLDARDWRQLRARASGDQDELRRQVAAADADAVRTGDDGATVEDLDVVSTQRLRVDAAEALDLGEHVVAQRRPVEARVADAPAEAARVVEIL